jgi:tetratricopeptide (TPR) repeat protein
MDIMKHKFWASYLLAALAFLPLEPLNITQVLATESVYQLAQSKSAFTQYMQLGYNETKRRNYRKALGYFQQAERLRPGDRYATAAIRNVTSYIQRGGGRNRIAFVPGKPGRVRSGGTRGSCFKKEESIIPLTATDKEPQRTTAEHPTFFFYIPQTSETLQALKFVLRDDDSIDPLYKATFKPIGQNGIVSVSVPTDKSSLQIGKQYTWVFSMSCDPLNPDKDSYIEGTIVRSQDENLSFELKQPNTDLERAVLFATAGFWEDALRTLANLRRQTPNDPEVQKYWEDLLNSVDIKEVVNKPLLPCCTVQK